MKKYKIILIGPAGAGKSSLLFQLKSEEEKNFEKIQNYQPTIGVDFYAKNISFGNKDIKIHIWDTAGQERFDCIVDTYYKNIDMVILMYDLSKSDNKYQIKRWIEKINFFAKDVPVVLIGNKKDIEINKFDKIYEEEIQNDFNLIKYFEISCLDIDNVNYVMDYIYNYVVNNIKKDYIDDIIILDGQIKTTKYCCF
tara:strand:+ start:830 stop:1417 length:588 start_codon:yes stop_codon:yes gene_type:complete